MAGVTAQGFTTKTTAEITADLNARFIGTFGNQFDVSAEGPDGQTIGIIAEVLSGVWEQAEAAYNAYSPTNAFGIGLDKVTELNGITRITNLPSSCAITFVGTAGTVVPAGYPVKTDDGLVFQTVALAVLPAIVTAKCTTMGAIKILAGDVHILTTPIDGLVSASNLEPGITGIVREEDPAFRSRRESSTISRGTNSIDAIYEGVRSLNLPYIAIIENNTSGVVDGIPAKAFLTVVEGGTPAEISRIIYDNKPQGIQAYGAIVTVIDDSKGYPHDIGISRATPTDVSIIASITNLPGASVDSVTLSKDALVEYINNLNISEDVYWSYLFPALLSKVPFIKINSITIKYTSGPTFGITDLPISAQQRARTDVSKVVVNVV
ncbi:baseplate J/gp47 family protein [Pseudomonas laurylsulfatiphila]|uniref:baseplate J/gp47 family protein n=1 Tax=Pseudomonas laurylsulfatiphila TaxID=2011015 RepID=UPI003D225CF8